MQTYMEMKKENSIEKISQSSGQLLRQGSGQALLIVVVFMGAVMLGISVIAGYLLTQRLRTSVDIMHSTQAIYAADAGIEDQLYEIFHNKNYLEEGESSGSVGGASYTAKRQNNNDNSGFIINSLGNSGVTRQLRVEVIFRN